VRKARRRVYLLPITQQLNAATSLNDNVRSGAVLAVGVDCCNFAQHR